MRIGEGSEYHLLRFLGRHRGNLNKAIVSVLERDGTEGVESINWLDFQYYTNSPTKDGEIQGMDFLSDDGIRQWQNYWPDKRARTPNRRGIQSWDAVGQLSFSDRDEWLLVEAKAYEDEYLTSNACGAGEGSLPDIERTLQATRQAMGAAELPWVEVREAWLGEGCYQVANRFACLNFLTNVVAPRQQARLLFVYFLNDSFEGGVCPNSASEWEPLILETHNKMGIPLSHEFKSRTHYLFLDVNNGSHFFGEAL